VFIRNILFHLQPEEGGRMFLLNINNHAPYNTVTRPRRPIYVSSAAQKPKTLVSNWEAVKKPPSHTIGKKLGMFPLTKL
jgi:hypothetical protein